MRANTTSVCAVVALTSLAVLSPPVWAQGAPPAGPTAAPDPAKIEEAKRHMVAGAAFYNDPSGHKCEEALREFGKAYELSGSLNALKGMAVCNLELERDGEAIEQYTKFLEGKGNQIDPAEKQQIDADLNALKSAVAYVTFTIDRPNVRVTDVRTPTRGFPITNRYLLAATGKKLGIHPGVHTFTASAEGLPDQTWQVEITNGGRYEHTFTFDKGKLAVTEGPGKPEGLGTEPDTQATTRPVPVAAYALGGLALGSAAATIGLGLWAKGKNSDYNEKNGKASAEELEDLRSSVKMANVVTDVFLGVTVASAVAATVVYVTRPTRTASASPGRGPGAGALSGRAPLSGALRWTVVPAVARGTGGAVVSGSF